jgi:signal transduction histidine kinase
MIKTVSFKAFVGWGINLNYNLLAWIRKRKKQDLFRHTQNRLSVQYSGLMMLFLTLFIIIVYLLINGVIFYEQKIQIQSLADQEWRFIQDALNNDNVLDKQELDNLNIIQGSGNQFFYYVLNPEGEYIFGDETVHRLRPALVHLVQGWNPQVDDIHYETIELPHRKSEMKPSDTEHKIHLMIVGRPIIRNNQLVGIFYSGKDISSNYNLREMFLILLIGLGVLFFGIALWVSYLMSKRAMIPIIRSFKRQKEFAADASHELRTPLSVLLTSIEALEMEEGINDFSRNILSTMKDEVKRTTKLVTDLLTLARSDSDEISLRLEKFNIQPSAEQLISSIEPLAKAKQINLYLSSINPLWVYADRERLRQLMYILLDNAIKYTPENGKVTLSLSIHSEGQSQSLNIKVVDTGIGINPDYQDRIFDRFYRVDKARSRELGSHGLGLSIAKWIVDAHQGKIQIASELGKGTTFTIKIPFKKEKEHV